MNNKTVQKHQKQLETQSQMPPIRLVKKPPLGAQPNSTKNHIPQAQPRFKSVARPAVKQRLEQVSWAAPTQRELERREAAFNMNFNSLLADERGGKKKGARVKRGSRSPTKQVIRNGQLVQARGQPHSLGPRRHGVQLKPLLSRPKVWIPNGSAQVFNIKSDLY